MFDSVLVTLADRKFVSQAKQVFSSVYHNTGWEGDYLLLSHGIPKGELEWFSSREIKIFDCESLTDHNIGIWPPTVISKFYMFTEGFKDWRKVVYLDGDVTAEASLGELGNPDGFRAVPDVHHIPVRGQFQKASKTSTDHDLGDMHTSLEELYDLNALSFNCGVFSFSTDVIKNDTFQLLLDLFTEYRDILRFPEQAIMNLHFLNEWSQIPIVYNNYYTRLRQPWRFGTIPFDGICNHFIHEKPWMVKDDYFYPKWKRNLDRAGYIDTQKRLPPTRIWSDEQIIEKTAMVEKLMVHRSLTTRIGDGIMIDLERTAGIVGRTIRKISPSLYSMIKGSGRSGDDE